MFNFDPTKKFEVITISPQNLFFTALITNLESLIAFIRQEFSLSVRSVKRENGTFQEDLLKNHPLGKILLEMHQTALTSQKQKTKATFNFEQFTEIVNFTSSATNYDRIKQSVDAINEIIMRDIKSFDAYYNYCDLDCQTAQKILTDLVNINSESKPTGVMLWRVCLGIKRDQGHAFVMNNSDLISRMRQVSSFQLHEPIDDTHLTILAIENPWMFAFFTKKQLIDLFLCSDKSLEILKKKLGLRSVISSLDDASELGNSLFSSYKDVPGKNMHFPVLKEQEQLKNALVNFLVGASVYARNAINDTVASRQFLTLNGFYREFVPFLYPATIIKLFCELDAHTHEKRRVLRAEMTGSEVDTKIDAQSIRGCVEFKWLLTRIEEDIKSGTDPKEYFSQELKIPYLLYELVLRGLLQFPLSILLTLFKAVDPDAILETLQLLDTGDLLHNYIEISEAKDKYYVDKNNPVSFHRLMQFLLSDEFIPLRLSWFNDQNKLSLILTYPVLLKGLSYKQMQQLMLNHSATILSNAEAGLKKAEFNPYVICPLLLAYLPDQHIQFIKLVNANPAMRKLYIDKSLPPDVVIHYIKNFTYDIVEAEIPEIKNYLDLELFAKADKTTLDKQLLLAMLADDKFKMVLKRYPSILNAFEPTILIDYINNTITSDAIFLRQVARQAMLIELILTDFDQLMSKEHLNLFKIIIQNFYSNPETEALVEKIEDELKLERETLIRNYDPVNDGLLIAKAQKSLEFSTRPYKNNINFPEHDSQAHIDEMLASKTIKADPIVFILEEMINAFPRWACRFVQSPGFYPVLNHYCMQILHTAGDNIKREHDQCFALFQYASLFIKLEEFENAAILLKDYLMLLGINISAQNYQDTAFYLLISCAERFSESKPLETFNYYIYAAELLHNAKSIDVVRNKKDSLLKDHRFKLALSMELAKKAILLIQKGNIPKEKCLDLITILRVLLTRGVPLINQHSMEISQEAIEHQNMLKTLTNSAAAGVAIRPPLHVDAELLQIFLRINHHLNALERETLINQEREDYSDMEGRHNNEKKLQVSKKIMQYSGQTRAKLDKELLDLMHNYTLALRKNHYPKKIKKLTNLSGDRDPDKATFFKKPIAHSKNGLLKPFLEKIKSASASPRVSFDGNTKPCDKEEELRLQKEREEMLKRVEIVISDNDSSDESGGEENNETPDLTKNRAIHEDKPANLPQELIAVQKDTSTERQAASSSAVNKLPHSEGDSDWQTRMNSEIAKIQLQNVEPQEKKLHINVSNEANISEKNPVDIEAEQKRKIQEDLDKAKADAAAEEQRKLEEEQEKIKTEEKRKLQEALKKAKEKEDARNKKFQEEARKKKEEEDKRTEEKLVLQRKNEQEERLRIQAIEDARIEKERLELQKKMEQEALEKKIAEEKRKKAEEDARIKKEQELKRRKEDEEKRKKIEEERKLKEAEASELHKKRLQEFKQKMLNDEREKKLAEEERIKELERKRKLREEREKELQHAHEVRTHEIKIAQITQEEQRLLEEERRIAEEERKLTEELKEMNAALQSVDVHNVEPQSVKTAKPEDPKKVLSKAIGKELLNTINDPQGNKAFEVARKRSGSVPAMPINTVASVGFFAQSTAQQKPIENDGSAASPHIETKPTVGISAFSQAGTISNPLSQPVAAQKTSTANQVVTTAKTSSVKAAIAAAEREEAAKNEAKAKIAERVRQRSSSQPPAKSAPLAVDDKSAEIPNSIPAQHLTESDMPPARPSLEGVIDENESARLERAKIAQQNMKLFAASKVEMEHEAEIKATQDEKSIKSGRRRGMSFTSTYEAISFFSTPEKTNAAETTSTTDASRTRLQRSNSVGRVTVTHPQPIIDAREETIQTSASTASRTNRFTGQPKSIAEKIGVGKLASVPLTPDEQQAIDAQVASSKAAMINKRK